MKAFGVLRRPFLVGLASCILLPVLGCDSGSSSETAGEIKQEVAKKSMQASGDFYKQKFQKQKR